MELGGLLPCSQQEPSIGPNSEPDETNQCHLILYLQHKL
jgi:hypothetical protein